MHKLRTMLITGVWLVVLGTTASAIDVEEVIWGFDGKVVPFRFNPVSLLVSNTTEDPVAFALQLTRSPTAAGERVGARIQESVFLSPYSSRWVQFYPYIVSQSDEWSVSWGRLPSQRFELQQPRIGTLARVALVDSNQLSARKASVKTFPEDLFPPFVSATENLQVLFLDHPPRWQQPRRQSLIDWVQRGGTLFLTRNSDHEFPYFTGQLSILNSPLPEQAIGQGVVLRADSPEDAVRMASERLGEPTAATPSTVEWSASESLFTELRQITTPNHNWIVIHILSLIYLGLVFPGWYLLSRRTADYRTTIAAFVGVALLLTIAFNIVGRRGYGESTTVNTVAIARLIESGSYDVLSWSNIFVTGGDTYDLKHDGTGDLYSTGNTYEKVNGTIDNGLDGSFAVDIPLFSSRGYMHQGKAEGPDWEITVKEFKASNELNVLRLGVPQGVVNIPRKWLLFRDKLYDLASLNGDLVVQGQFLTVSSLKAETDQNDSYGYRQQRFNERYQALADNTYRRLERPLLRRSLGLGRFDVAAGYTLPDDRVRLFLYTDLPESFGVKHEELVAQQGKVLYTIDVLLPPGAAESSAAEPSTGGAETGTDIDRDHLESTSVESAANATGDALIHAEAPGDIAE